MKTYELYKGDSFDKTIDLSKNKAQPKDSLEIRVKKNAYSSECYYDIIFTFEEESDSYDLSISKEKTKTFPVGKLVLEIRYNFATTKRKTKQYYLDVKVAGTNG